MFRVKYEKGGGKTADRIKIESELDESIGALLCREHKKTCGYTKFCMFPNSLRAQILLQKDY
jgi:hypothetical protein